MGGSGFAPRVGVIGASRQRQGLGPFFVRDLQRAGARVPCFLSTSADSARATRRELAEAFGVEANPYLDLDEMLAGEALDALAILSPAQTHRRYLEAARVAGLHVLCEKPFVWGEAELSRTTRRIVSEFEAAGLLLRENCLWPYTLPAFEKLHPGALGAPPRLFEMTLQPANPGVDRLGDSLPHALSLVQALSPGPGRLEDPSVLGIRGDVLEIAFSYHTAACRTAVCIRLRRTDAIPRRVTFAVDGRSARRVVDDDYRLFFADADRRVAVEDPLTLLVSDFVCAISAHAGARAPSQGREIAERMEMLAAIVDTYRRAESGEA